MARLGRGLQDDALSGGHPAGHRPLREAIAAYLAAARGVRCVADQVIIVNGSQQALSLIANVLLEPGDAAWVEEPGYFGAKGALLGAGAQLIPVPVDGEGMDVAAGRVLVSECPAGIRHPIPPDATGGDDESAPATFSAGMGACRRGLGGGGRL